MSFYDSKGICHKKKLNTRNRSINAQPTPINTQIDRAATFDIFFYYDNHIFIMYLLEFIKRI